MTQNIKLKWPRRWTSVKAEYSLEELNAFFTPLSYRDRLEQLYKFYDQSDILYTSSFGTKSIFLLHLIHQIRPTQPVHFIDTRYNFPETLAYKEHVADLLNLNVIGIQPKEEEHNLTAEGEWWKEHPKMCCSINKIAPLDPVVAQHKVWISGLMSYQTSFRSRLRVFEKQGDILKFHPLVDIDEGEFLYHLSYHKLPHHPLEAEGYGSVGCTHCTAKGEGREGRWQGQNKTECGLHPNYFNRKKSKDHLKK